MLREPSPRPRYCNPKLVKIGLIKLMTVAKVSTLRKLSIAARIAGQHLRQRRAVGAVIQAARATASHFGRVLGQLWLEVTGFVFLALAGIGALALVRESAKFHAGQGNHTRVVAAVCFTGLFAWFGVSSFWRVRKKH